MFHDVCVQKYENICYYKTNEIVSKCIKMYITTNNLAFTVCIYIYVDK